MLSQEAYSRLVLFLLPDNLVYSVDLDVVLIAESMLYEHSSATASSVFIT